MFIEQPLNQLTKSLEPTNLTVVNDSWKHRHHREMINNGAGSGETRSCISQVLLQFASLTVHSRLFDHDRLACFQGQGNTALYYF